VAADEADDYKPWEEPGEFRRDCVSHRGPLLARLVWFSYMCCIAAFCFAVPAVVGILLAVTVIIMAGRDLREMGAGRLDPRGEGQTEDALHGAVGSLLFNGLVAALVILIISVAVLNFH